MESLQTNKSSTVNILGPLSFTDRVEQKKSTIKCLFCELEFDENVVTEVLTHLYMTHKLIIADTQLIVDLPGYIRYWKHRFADNTVETFCTTVLMDQTPDGKPSKNETYYLLSDVLPEDKTLRYELQQQRLEKILAQQIRERTDVNFTRDCLFCKLSYRGTRVGYFDHLSEVHNLQLGRPDKLVFTDELLDTIREKMESLICIFCEHVFKDRNTLKEHMRKKIHKRINPDNRFYDKFYIVNYYDEKSHSKFKRKNPSSHNRNRHGASGNQSDASDEERDVENTDGDWFDWNDECVSIVCLFCEKKEDDFNNLIEHMKTLHLFDFNEHTKDLSFYEKIKIVNYIRRQIHLKNCLKCDKNFSDNEQLLKHMITEEHLDICNTKQMWDQPQYYFPTYENDTFLCNLENIVDDENESVVSETMRNLTTSET